MAAPLERLGPDLTKRLAKLEKAIVASRRLTARAAAIKAKEVQEAQMESDAGGDLVLGRVRSGKGAKIGARWISDSDGGDTSIRASGPLPLLANDMPEHTIAAKKKRALKIGVGFAANVPHPGTTGKDTWNKGREKAEPQIDRIIGTRTDKAVREAFRQGD